MKNCVGIFLKRSNAVKNFENCGFFGRLLKFKKIYYNFDRDSILKLEYKLIIVNMIIKIGYCKF